MESILFIIKRYSVNFVITSILLLVSSLLGAQNNVERALYNEGYENLRHISKPGKEIIFIENASSLNIQKSILKVREDIISLASEFKSHNIDVILLDRKIPILRMYTTIDDRETNPVWKSDFVFDEGIYEMKSNDYNFFEFESSGKLDLKFYPVFRFKNARLDVMYLLQFNINPTMELSLWRGAKVTAQIVFPVVNDYSVEEGKIRPGFITLSQQFRLPSNMYANLTIGNFNTFRGGVDLKMYKSVSKKIGIYAQASYTSYSFPMFNDWLYSGFDKFTWKVGANYVYKPLKIIFNASVQKFLANDISVRGEVTRYFKNSAVGFYIQSMAIPDYPVNGGFFFAFSLPPYKHNRNKFVKVTSGDYFSMEYIARPYGEYGRYFTTSPDENSSYNFFNRIHLTQIFEK
jgi:hypothetical protein